MKYEVTAQPIKCSMAFQNPSNAIMYPWSAVAQHFSTPHIHSTDNVSRSCLSDTLAPTPTRGRHATNPGQVYKPVKRHSLAEWHSTRVLYSTLLNGRSYNHQTTRQSWMTITKVRLVVQFTFSAHILIIPPSLKETVVFVCAGIQLQALGYK